MHTGYTAHGCYTSDSVSDGSAVYTPGLSENRSGTSAFYHPDAIGSTRDITNSSQSVTDTRRFDAFGMLAETTGSNPTPFGFAGGEQYQTDTDSGLMLLGHRYYDNTTGRFISRDPAYAGDNWYAYCGNNPLGGTDASGLEPTEGTKVPDDKLKYAPIKRGLPPIGDDGNPIELHHRGRDPNGPVDEGTRTDHRGPGNHKMNHPGPNQGVDHGSEWKKWREDYWKREWDRGRFRGLPAIDAPEPQPYDNYMPPSDPSGYDPRYPITINWPVLGIVIISIISIGAGQPEGAAAGAVALKPALAN